MSNRVRIQLQQKSENLASEDSSDLSAKKALSLLDKVQADGEKVHKNDRDWKRALEKPFDKARKTITETQKHGGHLYTGKRHFWTTEFKFQDDTYRIDIELFGPAGGKDHPVNAFP